jgi:hypothetical protein
MIKIENLQKVVNKREQNQGERKKIKKKTLS